MLAFRAFCNDFSRYMIFCLRSPLSLVHQHPQDMAKILRGALKTLPTTSSQGYQAPFSLSCHKVVLHYCDKWASSNGMRSFLANNAFNLAKEYPSVEFVVRKRSNKHPNIKGCFGKSYICLSLSPACGLTNMPQVMEGIK